MIPIIVLVILSLDQFTKFIITKNLTLNQPVEVIKDIFSLTLIYNRGAAFGLLKNQVPLFILTTFFAVILIVLNFRNAKEDKVYIFSLSLILGGALGNLIDRVLFGHVIDFLDFHIWPVFNIADSAITVGAIILAWSILFRKNVSGNL